MRGWFDAFREAGGPTLYASQRIAATHDNILLALYATFAALFLAFLIIIPGIRRNKIPTFILLTASMFVLASIVICRFSPNWHVSSSKILASYKRTTPQKLPGLIGVRIGLDFFNVTLQITEANSSHGRTPVINNLRFNEKYSWIEVDEVQSMYQESLHRGLPYPILTIAEVLSMDAGNFAWGRSYRLAGYYASIALWSALASWILMNILFCMVPRFSGYFMLLTGVILLACNGIYANLLPSPALVIRFEQGVLTFDYGWCFWMVLTSGFLCISFGVATIVADYFFPELLIEVHSSWKYNSKLPVHTHYPQLPFHKSATSPTSIIQIKPLEPFSPLHHSVSATNWTSIPQAASNADPPVGSPGDIIAEDPFIEEIDRASNIPFIIRTEENEAESIEGKGGDHLHLIRHDSGYANPAMVSIEMALRNEEDDENIVENTKL